MSDAFAAEGPSIRRRATAILVGAAGGLAYTGLLALAITGGLAFPLVCVALGAFGGAIAGLGWFAMAKPPERVWRPEWVPGEPPPLGALAEAYLNALDGPRIASLRLAFLIEIAGIGATILTYASLGERLSPSLFAGVFTALFLVSVACVTILPAFLLDEPTRRSFAVLNWAGAREWRRLAGSSRASAKLPLVPEERQKWLEENLRWEAPRTIDVEVLVLHGELDRARDAAARLPEATPHERYVKAEEQALVRYQAAGEFDRKALRDAAAAVPPSPERLEAEACAALFEARTLLPDGDWRAPILAVRDSIPDSDAVILFRDHAWDAFVISLVRLSPILLLLVGLTVALALLT